MLMLSLPLTVMLTPLSPLDDTLTEASVEDRSASAVRSAAELVVR